MAQINTTGNADIDTATAEIAVALRDAEPPGNHGYRYQHYYDEAIMAGTRQMDAPLPPLDDFKVASQAAGDMSFTEPVL